MAKAPKLDKATEEIAKRLLATPPKPHDDRKGSTKKEKRRGPKDRAASAKPPLV